MTCYKNASSEIHKYLFSSTILSFRTLFFIFSHYRLWVLLSLFFFSTQPLFFPLTHSPTWISGSEKKATLRKVHMGNFVCVGSLPTCESGSKWDGPLCSSDSSLYSSSIEKKRASYKFMRVAPTALGWGLGEEEGGHKWKEAFFTVCIPKMLRVRMCGSTHMLDKKQKQNLLLPEIAIIEFICRPASMTLLGRLCFAHLL